MSKRPRFRLPRSEPARFVLLCLLLNFVSVTPVLWFVYDQIDRQFDHRIADRIDDRQLNLMFGYRTGGITGLVDSIDKEIATGIAKGGAILLIDHAGRRIAGNLNTWPPALQGQTRWREMRLHPEGDNHPRRFALRTIALSGGYRLLVGTNVEDRQRTREAVWEALLASLLLSVPIGILAGFLLLRFTNRRIDGLRLVAGRIAQGDLAQRLDVANETQAFARLAVTINTLLERIEELVSQMGLVTDALAHDLRSPLTRMRASIEKAVRECSDDDAQQAFDAISHELEGMLRLISATLEISRTEAGMGREDFSQFDLGELLKDLCEMYHPLAEERGIAIDVDNARAIHYLGNRELLGQAVSNLVDNALKYGGGKDIKLGADETEHGIRLWIADRGPGIPEHRRDDAIRKYGRLDGSRTSDGSGLGLALVRAVARLHGGDLLLEDNAPGLRAVISLPKPSPDKARNA